LRLVIFVLAMSKGLPIPQRHRVRYWLDIVPSGEMPKVLERLSSAGISERKVRALKRNPYEHIEFFQGLRIAAILRPYGVRSAYDLGEQDTPDSLAKSKGMVKVQLVR
jgi:hypothetical protein